MSAGHPAEAVASLLSMTGHASTIGHHWLADYRGCDAAVLADIEGIEALLVGAIRAAGATPLEHAFHRFVPDGVSGAVLLEESHITIHTWPGKGYAAVDFYTCGDTVPEAAHRHLSEGLRAEDAAVVVVQRGLDSAPSGDSPMRVIRQPDES